MLDTPIHVIDFEGSLRSGVLEWGVVSLKAGALVEAQTRLCGSRRSILNTEVAQHGISDFLVRGLPPFNEDWDTFMHLRETGVFCSHHSSVENNLLRRTWAYPRACKDFFNNESRELVADWGPWLDTLQIYRNLYPDLASYKLEALIEQFNLGSELKDLVTVHCEKTRAQFHCALYDALAAALLLKRLFGLKELVDLSLNQLFILSSSSQETFESRTQQELL